MNPNQYEAALNSLVWRDMSHFGRFVVAGADAANLLHHLSSNDIKAMKPGEVREGALVSSKARVLDFITVIREDRARFLVVTSPNRREMFEPHARQFILFRQDVKIEDQTGTGGLYGVFGAESLKADFSVAQGLKASTGRLPGSGWLVTERPAADLTQIDDHDTYNVLRVEAGVPVAGAELTEDINPWEAGLDSVISLHKGCYNGQEVIARLNTYKKIKQLLRGLHLDGGQPLPANGCPLRAGGKNAGFVTSAVSSPRFGAIALAYVRSGFQEPGSAVEVKNEVPGAAYVAATVTALPFGAA